MAGQRLRLPPLVGLQLHLTLGHVVEVEVAQQHTEGHSLVGAALGFELLGPVQQQRQLFTAQVPVLCGVRPE